MASGGARVLQVGEIGWARLSQEQRTDLINWVAQQVGHRVRGVQRVEYRTRFFRSAVLYISGIVKIESPHGSGRYLSVLDPMRPNELLRFTGETRVRAPLPSWWGGRRA